VNAVVSVSATRSQRKRRLHRVVVWIYLHMRPAFLLDVAYSCTVRLRIRQCGRGVVLPVTTTIRGHKNIIIGDGFSSLGHLKLYANEDGYLRIGSDCSANSNVQLGAAGGTIIVGDHVMFGANVVVRAANHGMRRDMVMKRQPWTPGKIVIEDDVWVGSNAVITADVVVARGTVVGAGAVVTRSTEAYSIVAGVPARKIGERP
jgi:galactoside O-acetyltransferase